MFKTYVVFLILSGIAMLVIAGIRSGQRPMRRVWNGIFGAGFLIYGLYLLLAFGGGQYYIFFYAFILPILMIAQFFRDRGAMRSRQQAASFRAPSASFGSGQPPTPWYEQPAAPGYGQPPPPGYGQPPPPGYGQPPPPGAGSQPSTATPPSVGRTDNNAWEWSATSGWQSGSSQPPPPPPGNSQPPQAGFGPPSGEQPRDTGQ